MYQSNKENPLKGQKDNVKDWRGRIWENWYKIGHKVKLVYFLQAIVPKNHIQMFIITNAPISGYKPIR